MNTQVIPTSIGPKTPEGLVDELTYINFAANRSYGITAERYASMFHKFPVDAYEARYQAELAKVEKAFGEAA